ncbi:hypothetical protein N5853_14475 (plasmid) [Bartonella sp. HY329]|uniref:hypothetical protein n=1 Tax=unclassified Bartonella TaxID=2645622 RepID=UPI0021C9CC99|nr:MULTISPECIES: hypothetical protein [unclassified Bartonella]UXM96522.1 hypothetical protein N5853_14475 [Bartonella sp. HY329]UXN10845.1 hypothetical protein N5852_14480 [Bartonella sp. HY328]
MKSFINAYLSTLAILYVLGFVFSLFLFRNDLDLLTTLLPQKMALMVKSLAIYFALMWVVALPFFKLVTKRRSFSWLFSTVMWFLINTCMSFFTLLRTGEVRAISILGILVISILFGVIFLAPYSWFKRREKPTKLDIAKEFR